MSGGGRIPRAFIDDLLNRVDIVELIDNHVPLKKAGANYVARCPFHNEKTPSFSVNRSRQFYHCFGCGVSGNAISFLMEFNHLDFVEAVEDLAAFANLDVPREQAAGGHGAKPDSLSDLYTVMAQVAAYYREQLQTHAEGRKATAYLHARGVSGDVAKDYLLGFAPQSWKDLSNCFDLRRLQEGGLLGKSEHGELYGRFRGRLMFPIRDKRGRVVGFGGRVLDDSLPKYLNSPETAIFHKGSEVYGLYELLQRNSKPARIVVVEGYMDVIALAQFGIRYSVATLGTSASQTHLELLFRFASELVFCFDGDKAGREAAWRAMEPTFPCLKDGRQVRIMLLPPEHDPDSLIRHEGVGAFVERIKNADALSDYFFSRLAEEADLSKLEHRAAFVNKAKPYLEKLPDGVFREMMFAKLGELSGYRSLAAPEQITAPRVQPDRRVGRDKSRISAAKMALALLVQNPVLIELADQKGIELTKFEFPGSDAFNRIVSVIVDHRPVSMGILLEYFRGGPLEKAIKTLAFLPLQLPPDGLEAEFSDALDRLLAQSRSSNLNQLLAKEKSVGLSQEDKEKLRKLLEYKRLSTVNKNL